MHAEGWHNQLKDRRTGIHTTATIDDVIYFLDDVEQRQLIKDEIIEEGQMSKTFMHAESWHNQLKDRRTGIHTTATIDDVNSCFIHYSRYICPGCGQGRAWFEMDLNDEVEVEPGAFCLHCLDENWRTQDEIDELVVLKTAIDDANASSDIRNKSA